MKHKNEKYTEADLKNEIRRLNKIHTALTISCAIVMLMFYSYVRMAAEFAQFIGKKMAWIVVGIFVAIVVVLIVFIRIFDEKLNTHFGASLLIDIANKLEKDEQKEDME